ncbi:MAG: DUF4625 domain-containing protein [Bacteroidales bacterium]|nr:DUF4625 domain-containing protein [Bacteroidales bacterium]MBN2748382.1 DUF4625 domain-containing protein [Bacteroidales bacterium]
MIKRFAILTVALFATALFSACEKDGDTQKPTITIIEPTSGTALIAGDEIHFEADFSDNQELKSYKIDIHSAEDGHTHTKSIAAEDHASWALQKSWSFEAGQKNAHIHHHEIVIPTTIDGVAIETGRYHLLVYCTDKDGNESWKAVSITIAMPK